MAIALAIFFFFRLQGIEPTLVPDSFWARYGVYALLGASVPAMYYLRTYKRALNAYLASATPAGAHSSGLHMDLLRRLSVGGAFCELPMAVGVLQLLTGGEMRLFIGGALFAVALRLSYRPTRR